MLKKLLILAFAGLLSPAYAAGTIPFSFYPQVDLQGRVMPGCKFYTIQAGTVSTPQNAYQDSALTLPLPNPQTCDASGRLPQMFLADGQIKVRLTSSTGVNVLTADNILVIGPSGGGGGGGTVDPTTIHQVGDSIWKLGVGVRTGFVRMNGRTIGSATSGATERANADTAALYDYLWQNLQDFVCPVSGGRGASSAADFAANKPIGLPSMRGRAPFGLDDMGNSLAGVITSGSVVAGSNILAGSYGGAESRPVAQLNLPNITLPVTGSLTVSSVINNILQGGVASVSLTTGATGVQILNGGTSAAAVTSTGSLASGVTGALGSATPLPIMNPFVLGTWYMKL